MTPLVQDHRRRRARVTQLQPERRHMLDQLWRTHEANETWIGSCNVGFDAFSRVSIRRHTDHQHLNLIRVTAQTPHHAHQLPRTDPVFSQQDTQPKTSTTTLPRYSSTMTVDPATPCNGRPASGRCSRGGPGIPTYCDTSHPDSPQAERQQWPQPGRQPISRLPLHPHVDGLAPPINRPLARLEKEVNPVGSLDGSAGVLYHAPAVARHDHDGAVGIVTGVCGDRAVTGPFAAGSQADDFTPAPV